MLIQSKIQIEQEDYEFIRNIYKDLHYRSFSEYVRKAINARVSEDRKKLRELKRKTAMETIGNTLYTSHFESIDGDDFENR
jgi:Arc/MetJ-type ribon-helix-helix transcriptional regulator